MSLVASGKGNHWYFPAEGKGEKGKGKENEDKGQKGKEKEGKGKGKEPEGKGKRNGEEDTSQCKACEEWLQPNDSECYWCREKELEKRGLA